MQPIVHGYGLSTLSLSFPEASYSAIFKDPSVIYAKIEEEHGVFSLRSCFFFSGSGGKRWLHRRTIAHRQINYEIMTLLMLSQIAFMYRYCCLYRSRVFLMQDFIKSIMKGGVYSYVVYNCIKFISLTFVSTAFREFQSFYIVLLIFICHRRIRYSVS